MEIIPGPDFPTGGIILGRSGIYSAYSTGRGSIVMRGKVAIEAMRGDREAIIITEVPFQVNKATMIEKMAELVRDKRIEGISDIRDESDRQGYRVVIELKRDANADVVLNQLYRFTPLQTSFGANMVALNGGKPEVLTLIDMLRAFIAFREEVVSRRTKFLLRKARDRAHVLVGLAIAVANIDEVIKLIRSAPDPQTAREQLMERRWPAADVEALILLIDDPRHRINEDGTYNLSEEQARAILELRLQRLTALGRDEIADELNKIGDEITDYLDILSSRARIQTIVKDELAAVRDEFGTPRRTEIADGGADMEDEDLIQREDMVVTVTPCRLHQARAAVALPGAAPRRQGPLRHVDQGRGFRHPAVRRQHAHAGAVLLLARHRLQGEGLAAADRQPAVARQGADQPAAARSRANASPRSCRCRRTRRSWGELDVMFATTRGTVRRNKLSDFVQVNRNGKIAMKLEEEGDEILGVETCTDDDDVLLTAELGPVHPLPASATCASSPAAIRSACAASRMAEGDRVISMAMLGHVDADACRTRRLSQALGRRAARWLTGEDEEIALTNEEVGEETDLSDERYEFLKAREQFVLTVTEYGYGKRSSSYDFRLTGRGGKGIRATDVSKTAEIGQLVATFPVGNDDQIMLVSDGGQVIRVPVDGIRIASRATKGVTIFNTAEGEKVVSVERISEPQGEEEEESARRSARMAQPRRARRARRAKATPRPQRLRLVRHCAAGGSAGPGHRERRGTPRAPPGASCRGPGRLDACPPRATHGVAGKAKTNGVGRRKGASNRPTVTLGRRSDAPLGAVDD